MYPIFRQQDYRFFYGETTLHSVAVYAVVVLSLSLSVTLVRCVKMNGLLVQKFFLCGKMPAKRWRVELVQRIYSRYINVTDGRTDRRTTYDSNTALAVRASRGKNATPATQVSGVSYSKFDLYCRLLRRGGGGASDSLHVRHLILQIHHPDIERCWVS